MAIPDCADERSYNRFSRDYVGKSHGDNGSSYRTHWDSQCDAKPTKMINTFYRPVCAYCGNMGLPLQPNIEHYGDYSTTGYTCVCKGAMDEEQYRHELTEMEKKHTEELRALKRREPKANPDVIKALVNSLTEKMAKASNLHEVQRILDQLKNIAEE